MLPAAIQRVRRAIFRLADKAAFDWRYGTDTTDFVPNENLAATSANLAFGTEYQPTAAREFQRMVRELPITPKNFTFVDIGCGKGRTLLLAAQAGFHRIVGVDYSSKVLASARQNIARFQPRAAGAQYETVAADAVDFNFPPGDCVLFFFNPFNVKVMGSVVENLRRSHAANPRRFYVILYNCVKQYPLFDTLPFLHPLARRPRHRGWLTQTICEWATYGPVADGLEGVHSKPVIR